jgi:hypothetical protein
MLFWAYSILLRQGHRPFPICRQWSQNEGIFAFQSLAGMKNPRGRLYNEKSGTIVLKCGYQWHPVKGQTKKGRFFHEKWR